MTRDQIIAAVERDRYDAESALARADASRGDYGRGADAALDIPHEIEGDIWDAPISWQLRIALMFSVFDDMPSYGHLMYVKHHYREFGPDARASWWSEVRARLAGADVALRQPLQYALWCDFFEDPDTVDDAWQALTGTEASRPVLQAVLPVSGPVPYLLKQAVYDRLLPDPTWHEAIFESLLGSAFDVYGQLDVRAARAVFSRLRLAADTPQVEELRARLAAG